MASEIPEVRPTHFFKIILAQSLHEGKLVSLLLKFFSFSYDNLELDSLFR